MAQLSETSFLHGSSGKIGDIIFRTRNGKTYASASPVKRSVKPTLAQLRTREKFQACSRYAKAAIAIPEIKEAYELGATDGRSAYNMAFADCFAAPKIISIDISGYRGKKNDRIVVHATDNFKVNEVLVMLYKPNMDILEGGRAEPDADGLHWSYKTLKENKELKRCIVKASAFDLPGNESVMQIVL